MLTAAMSARLPLAARRKAPPNSADPLSDACHMLMPSQHVGQSDDDG
jgi:hypothetical protein